MSKWEKVKLEDVCNILDAQRIPITASAREHGQYPYYGANGIQDYVSDYIFNGEFVLIAEDGGNFGSKTKPIAYRVSGKCWVNNHAHVLSAKSNINIDYLCYSLMFYDVSKIISGTTRAKLNQAALRKMEIPLPTLEEQHKIASILNTVSEALKLHKQQLSELDLLVKSKFVEMFGDPVINSKNWAIYKLKELTSKIGSGATPIGGKKSYLNNGISLVRSMNVYNGYFKFDDLAYINKEQAKKLDFVELSKKDVLINITGASVARSCIVPNTVLPARVNQHVSILRCKDNILNSIFLNRLLIDNNFQRMLLSIGELGGATRQAITKQQLEELDIPVPPIELQNKFASFVEHVDKLKSEVQKSIEQLQTLFNSLMQEYFE